jgi:NAD-dependent dihydropyrimidine dehydrogenase PreA subunit/flavodoxin
MKLKAFVVYCSPSGTTRRVANVIENVFQRNQADVEVLDLGKTREWQSFQKKLESAGEHACLFVGSPVYGSMAVPPVRQFVASLPACANAWAVPFVTWGEACSGLALWQLGDALVKKGFRVAGAAKVVAVHSMMWQEAEPAGKGHPDEIDLEMVTGLVENIATRHAAGTLTALALDVLDYQPSAISEGVRKKMSTPRKNTPKEVDPDACTQCGVCESECPAQAISLEPYPVFGENCFGCFSCIRLCPEEAIQPAIPLPQIADLIRKRVETIQERPLTQVYP